MAFGWWHESAFLRVVSTSNAVPAKFYIGLRRNSKELWQTGRERERTGTDRSLLKGRRNQYPKTTSELSKKKNPKCEIGDESPTLFIDFLASAF